MDVTQFNATSNLDAVAEQAFPDGLRRVRRETQVTIIAIAHRFSAVLNVDQIVVLKRGRVTAVGSHGELLRASRWYARAFANQTAAPDPVRAEPALRAGRT